MSEWYSRWQHFVSAFSLLGARSCLFSLQPNYQTAFFCRCLVVLLHFLIHRFTLSTQLDRTVRDPSNGSIAIRQRPGIALLLSNRYGISIGVLIHPHDMSPHSAPPLNLSRREDSPPKSSAGPMIRAIFGIAIGIFILSLLCKKVIGAMKRHQSRLRPGTIFLMDPPFSDADASDPRPHHGGLRVSGGSNTRGPKRPNVHARYGPPLTNPPVPEPVRPRPTASPGRHNLGGFPFGPVVHSPSARIDHFNHSIPVDVRWAQRRDPRRSRSEHRP